VQWWGPGAFTGVRIATAAAQAIALGGDLPVAPVSTLAAIAHRCHREHSKNRVAVAIDARMGEVYWGAYEIADRPVPVGPMLLGNEQVCAPSSVESLDASWVAAGTGWQTYITELTDVTGATIIDGIEPFPHALDILMIGSEQLAQGKGVAPENALPVYLRDNVALKQSEQGRKK